MSYLKLARSALTTCEESEISPSATTSGRCEESANCEKSEKSEKSPERDLWCPLLTSDEAERLKARIIAAVTVDPAVFDRAEYEALMVRWKACDDNRARQGAERGVA